MPSRAIIISGVVVVVLLLSSLGTVFAAQASLPQQALYPVKLWSESVRWSMAPDPSSQFDLSLEFAARRLDEGLALIQQKTALPGSMVAGAIEHLDESLDFAAGQDDAGLEMALQRVSDILKQRQQALLDLQKPIDPQMATPIESLTGLLNGYQEVVQMGLANPDTFRQRLAGEADVPFTPSDSDVVTQPGGDTDVPTATEELPPGYTSPMPTEDGIGGTATPPAQPGDMTQQAKDILPPGYTPPAPEEEGDPTSTLATGDLPPGQDKTVTSEQTPVYPPGYTPPAPTQPGQKPSATLTPASNPPGVGTIGPLPTGALPPGYTPES